MQETICHASILLVDDDEALLQALPELVHLRMRDVQVTTCGSAPHALEMIEQYDYDAIVTDVKMPGMDGLELLGHIREIRADTPVLLITGHGDHDLAIHALRGGAYDYILKPIDRDTFVAALQRAIQTRQLRRTVTEQQLTLALHAKSLERLVEKRTNELVTANATKDKFLNVVSHELKSPLTNLRGKAQYLYRQLEQGEAREATLQGLADIERSIHRTEILTQDLLDISLIDSNMFVLERQRCDLVERCNELLHQYTAGTTHSYVNTIQQEPIEVEIDANRISQILINLLSNARKFSAKEAPITVILQRRDYEVMLSVQDLGVGIPPEELPHIFEEFYRVAGVEVQPGTRPGLGLGLYISRKIVERHGGHIEVQSTVGQGSSFSIVLPLYINPEQTDAHTPTPAAHARAVWTISHS